MLWLYGHIKPVKRRTQFPEFCRYLRTLYPPNTRIAIVCDNFSPHLTTKRCQRVGSWAAANNVEIAYTPTNSSWLNPRRTIRCNCWPCWPVSLLTLSGSATSPYWIGWRQHPTGTCLVSVNPVNLCGQSAGVGGLVTSALKHARAGDLQDRPP